jgi:hypothetical protein
MPSDAVASSSLAVEKSLSMMEDARSPAFFLQCERTFGLLRDILSTCGKFMNKLNQYLLLFYELHNIFRVDILTAIVTDIFFRSAI